MTDCMQKWRVGQIWDGCRSEIYSSDSSSRLCPPSNCTSNNSCVKGSSSGNQQKGTGWAVMLWCRWTRAKLPSWRQKEPQREAHGDLATDVPLGAERFHGPRGKYASCQYAPSLMTLKRVTVIGLQASVLNGCDFFLSLDELRTLTLGSQESLIFFFFFLMHTQNNRESGWNCTKVGRNSAVAWESYVDFHTWNLFLMIQSQF